MGCCLKQVAREGLTEKVRFEQRGLKEVRREPCEYPGVVSQPRERPVQSCRVT